MRRSAVFWSGAIAAQGAAELDFAESESIAQTVGDLGKLLEFFTFASLKQIELLFAVGEGAEPDSQKADFTFAIEVPEEKFLKDSVDSGVERGGFGESFRTRVSIEALIANRKGKCASGESGFAKTLARFL